MAFTPTPFHHRLARLAYKWKGSSRLWFQPDHDPEIEAFEGRGKLVFGGRFVELAYKTRTMKKPTAGLFLLGYSSLDEQFTATWLDTFHNGTAAMMCRGDRPPGRNSFSVLGDYPDGQGGRWGWRTEFSQPNPNRLVIRAFNIPPGEAEQRALLIELKRA